MATQVSKTICLMTAFAILSREKCFENYSYLRQIRVKNTPESIIN